MKKLNAILFLVLFPMMIFGWWENTHRLLSAYACINSKLIKEDLILKLNLDMGAAQPLFVSSENKTVSGWIYDGAEKEDAGNVLILKDRSGRHFHNPLKIFSEAGLMRIIEHVQSSILWAQDGAEQNNFEERDMSWQKVKEYYYNALISDTEEYRHLNFGMMFKGLGHQMHLVQDMGNPEHTRNDNHPIMTIEDWAESHIQDIIEPLCKNPVSPTIELRTMVFDQSTQKTLYPITRLSDADIYDPLNPSPSVSLQQGLAEYSNANFLSDDTIFSSDFPFPRSSGIDKQFPEVIIDYIADEKGLYASRKNEGEGEAIDHFLRVSYLQRKLDDIGASHIYDRSYYLDYVCYKDYVSKLIPRSVGYSAALLDYFFRGEIEITLPGSDSVYALCVDPTKGFEKISLLIKNVTANNEEMTKGQISLVVSYRTCEGGPFVPNPPIPGIERFYKLYNYSGVTSIPRDNPLRLDVDMSGDALPATAVDITLTVVFKGDLGTEPTNAVAMGFKDISEPTPIDLFNNSDKVCFNGNYVNYDNAALWDAVDINPKNGVIDCLNNAEIDITRRQVWPIYLSFNGETAYSGNYYFKYEDGLQILPGETPKRIYVLTDTYPNPFSFSILTHTESMDNDSDCSLYPNNVHSYFPYTNKLEWISSPEPDSSHYEHFHSPIGYFRGFPYWMLNYFENSSVPADTVCLPASSGSEPAPSASANKKTFGNPKIVAVGSKKKSE